MQSLSPQLLNKTKVYKKNLFFSILSFLLIYFQRHFLFWLFQTQVSFSVLHISYLLISETPLTDVQSMITRGGILVGIVLVLEVLLLFGFSLYFFTAFWL